MKRKKTAGKLYFYGRGQSARARGWTKQEAEVLYSIHAVPDFARIAFDKGYRGLSL